MFKYFSSNKHTAESNFKFCFQFVPQENSVTPLRISFVQTKLVFAYIFTTCAKNYTARLLKDKTDRGEIKGLFVAIQTIV